MAGTGYEDFNALKRAVLPVHQRGVLTDARALDILQKVENAIYNGGGANLGEPRSEPLRIEGMVKTTRLVSTEEAEDKTDKMLVYPWPADMLEARAVRLIVPSLDEIGEWVFPGYTDWLRLYALPEEPMLVDGSDDFGYLIEGRQYKIPISTYPTPQESAPVIRITYWASLSSLATEGNFVSRCHPELYYNGFLALIFSEERLNSEARKYWQYFISQVLTLNETQGTMSGMGQGEQVIQHPDGPFG